MTQDTDNENSYGKDYLAQVSHVTPRMRRIRQIAIAASAAIVLIAGCILVSSGAEAAFEGDIMISEVVSSNRTSLTGPGGSSPDWIELYNRSDKDINLSGFSFGTSLDGPRHVLGDINIAAGGYTVLYADTSSSAASTGFSLSRDGETLYLFGPDGNVLECINIPALFTDISYVRQNNGSFNYCLQPTPAAANDTQIEPLAVYEAIAEATNLVVTEVMPNPSMGSAWVELYNAGETDAALSLFYIADYELDATPYRLPDSTLAAGQYAVIYAGGAEDVLSVPFRFGTGDHGVYLFDVTGSLRNQLTWTITPGSDTAVVAADTYTKMPTPGAPNSADTFTLNDRAEMNDNDPIRISEVLVSGTYRDSDHNAWAEVCNTSDQAVSLLGYYLSDDEGDPLRWAFPDISLEPGGYTVVFLSGNTEFPEELHTPFLVAADEGALYLTETASMRTDTFVLPTERADNVSIGRTESGDTCYYDYPSPGAANAEGFGALPDAIQNRVHGVYISEVCATGGEADWIELVNGSDAAIDLSGWYLSDDADNPLQWRIPSLVIEAGGYTVIEANGKTASAAPFGISISGETLLLSNANGALVDAIQTGTLRPGLTCGRCADDDTLSRVFFTQPTPGTQNSGPVATGYAAVPQLSETGLYHTNAFQLSIFAPTLDAVIYYTLDGSEPDETDSQYTAPITIDQNTVVRAIACAPGLMSSDIATATYLFDDPHTIPVFCLSGEPSEMNTIFNRADRNYKPEYGANVEYYETDGTLGVCFPAGLKPKGRSSLEYDQKSVTIRLKGKYGRSEITYPFFENGKLSTFSELTLRTGAQDMFAANLRDAFFQKLGQNLRVDSVRTRYVAVYVNGHYWGLYSMDEEQEEGYFKAYFGIGYNNIDMIDRNNTVLEGSCDNFLAVRQNARQWNLSDNATFAEFAQLVDVDACMDYLILNTYFANGDVVNQRFWHTRDGSVKWRPLLFDLDWSMRFDTLSRNTFPRYFNPSGSAAGNGTITYMDIFCGLKRNPAWREAFIDRFIELAYTEFDTDRVLALYDETVAVMEPEMARQIARWHTHRGVASWRAQTDSLRNVLEKRRDVVLKQMAQAFGLSNAELQARIEAFTSTH